MGETIRRLLVTLKRAVSEEQGSGGCLIHTSRLGLERTSSEGKNHQERLSKVNRLKMEARILK